MHSVECEIRSSGFHLTIHTDFFPGQKKKADLQEIGCLVPSFEKQHGTGQGREMTPHTHARTHALCTGI
jgi:hypothetical protein